MNLRNSLIEEFKSYIDVEYIGVLSEDYLYSFGNYLFRFSTKHLYVYIVTDTTIELSYQTRLSDIKEINSNGIYSQTSSYIYV